MTFFSGMFSKRPITFADEMVEKICRQFPPSSEAQLEKKGAKRRLEIVLENIMGDLDAFQKEIQLGLVGKARLGNAFRWKLTEKGFSKKFADALTEGVIKQIAIK
jgi:hypothetical protein